MVNIKDQYFLFFIFVLFGCNSNSTHLSNIKSQALEPIKETIIENLKSPWSMAFLSEEEALVAEKDGDLLRVNLLTKEKISIQGFPDDLADTLEVKSSWFEPGTFPSDLTAPRRLKYNAGIFEVVLDPDFENNQLIYISYVAENEERKSATKVIRAKLYNNTLTEIKTLLLATPYAHGLFHYGGGLTFGRDGKLYITIGNRLFSEGQEPAIPISQDLKDKRGKIYRINSDGTIPDDNPDFGKDAVPGIYAIGIRSAQGITVEPNTGKIWFSEHGTTQGDEINVLEAGANYGWPIHTTGKHRANYVPPKMEGTSFTDPVWFWHQTIAPTGLTFYEGDEFPWENDLIVPGLSRGNFWRLDFKNEVPNNVEELFMTERERTRKAVQSPEGKLYILTDGGKGKIIRIKNGN